MRRVPSITDAEWEVMSVVWDEHPVAASRVCAVVGPRKGWVDRTVKTLLGRLVRKGALGFRVAGRHYLYHPKVSREDCVRAESKSFGRRVFGGETSPMLLNMIREADLSAEEVAELRRILDEKDPR